MPVTSRGVEAAPFLTTFDSLVRCEICKDIYTAPVTIKQCGHSFCSRCLLSHIHKGSDYHHCPTCRKPGVHDSSFIKQPSLEAMAEAWRAEDKLHQSISDDRYAQAEPTSSSSARHRSTKRKASPEIDFGSDDAESSRAAVRRSQRDSTKRTRGSSSRNVVRDSSPQNVIEVSDSDDAYDPDTTAASYQRSAARNARRNASPPRARSPEGVQCPLCLDRYPQESIEGHASRCNGEPKVKTSKSTTVRNFMGPSSTRSKGASRRSERERGDHPREDKRMTRLPAKLTKPAQLRAALTEAGLSVTGSKERMSERHSYYVDLYNANLDASERFRKPNAQLLQDVYEWERRLDAPAVSANPTRTHLRQYEQEFKDLIDQARQSHEVNKRRRAVKQSAVPAGPVAPALSSAEFGGTDGLGGVQHTASDGDVRMGSPEAEEGSTAIPTTALYTSLAFNQSDPMLSSPPPKPLPTPPSTMLSSTH